MIDIHLTNSASKDTLQKKKKHLVVPIACLSPQLPGCNIAWYDHSDPGPLFIVSSVVDSGLSKLPATALTHPDPWSSWVTAISHQGPGTTGIMGVLQQHWGRCAEL